MHGSADTEILRRGVSTVNVIVTIGTLFLASGAALVYYGNHRASETNAERVTGSVDARIDGAGALSSTQAELDSSTRVWPIYAEVLSRIRGYLQAHIAESGDSRITVDLPALPENLYKDGYSGTVSFGSTIVWTFEVFAPRPADPRSPPTLTIRFDDPSDLQEGPRLILFLDTSHGEVRVIDTNGVVPAVGPLPAVIPEEDPEAAIAQLTRSMVEAQLLSGSSPRGGR